MSPTDADTDAATDADHHPAVIELRQYTLRPGRREELIELFDREFIETQEETGMVVLGQFRDPVPGPTPPWPTPTMCCCYGP
ncbi:NIPSNAP family protein [Streptomyces sp. RCU064]|uniref:NIPSNAP family protein n=1 Tax=Streptomyces rugosispiralis TaxID=2967341 RepID=A0ABT1UNT0_9ACTN|nr:NIPSNAP family protein [Streptomyces rugosispiralis]MCQ8186788.1 NIPSNAP family protein [Streptomyces rugosispiralis]